jgi:nitrogen fixation NifU-like protein
MKKLYKQVLLDHYKAPRHFGAVAADEAGADIENPSCGDHFRMVVDLQDHIIRDVRIDGQGCAVSTASCSIMAEQAIGKSVEEIRRLHEAFVAFLNGADGANMPDDLKAFDGVRGYRTRIHCASLCWTALLQALDSAEG